MVKTRTAPGASHNEGAEVATERAKVLSVRRETEQHLNGGGFKLLSEDEIKAIADRVGA